MTNVMIKKEKIVQPEQLLEEGLIKEHQLEEIKEVVDQFSLSITKEMLDQIDTNDPNDPIAKQFVPEGEELNITQEELADPIGDTAHMPVKGVIHRYPDRCLFLPMTVCSVYCRFCFRREKVGSGANGLNRHELEAAFEYIENCKTLREVILTGGDPLTIAPKFLSRIMERLSSFDHIKVIRFHSRVPVVDPERVNDEMINILKCDKPVYICVHTNHPNEFTDRAKEAIALLVDNGIPLLSQSVLLKGINADPDTLKELMYTLIENRIKPYYLHHGDFAKGTGHFRTTIEEGRELVKKLRGYISGICQPTYVLDIPGGYGKVPITHNYFQPMDEEENGYLVEDFQGKPHQYPPGRE